MDANQTCDLLLSYIKKSNLNWSITESPFSVSVTLKKTFIKNKDGSLCESGLEPTTFPSQQGKSSTLMKPSCPSMPSSLQQQTQVNPYPTKNTSSTTLQQQVLKNYYPSKNTLSTICQQQQSLVTPNPTINTFPRQQQALVNNYPNKNTFTTRLKQQALVNPYPTQNTFHSSLQQQALMNTSSTTSLRHLALDNPHPNKNTFSSGLQEQAMVNSYPIKKTFPSGLNLLNPYPTKTNS